MTPAIGIPWGWNRLQSKLVLATFGFFTFKGTGMIRPLTCSIAGLLIAFGSCQSLLAQSQTATPAINKPTSALDSALEKLTSKKAMRKWLPKGVREIGS